VEGPPSPFHRLDVATVSLILDYAVADVSELLSFREVCVTLDRHVIPCYGPSCHSVRHIETPVQ
jgi:hypothetical protein